MKRRETVRPGNLVRVVEEGFEDLGQGVDDERVRKRADIDGISTTKLRFWDCGEVTIGAAATSVSHNLDRVPHFMVVTMRTAGTIWEVARAETHRVWLQADAANRKARVIVFA